MKRGSESVSFIGLGYVGLCTAAGLASRGMKIIGVDIDGEKIAKLAKGETPLHEPGLGSMLKSAVKNRRIQFTTDIDRVVEADVTFITVGTPSNQDGSISLTFVKKAAEDVGSAIRGADAYHLVVVKSTVIPGTTSALRRCRDRCKGDRLGPSDRVSLPQGRTRLRRFLLPQGPPSPDRVQPGPRLRPRPPDRSRRGQPAPSK